MSYNHIAVTEAIKAHERTVDRTKEVVTAESKHTYVMHDGLLVSKELAVFMAEVQKAFRGVKFYGGHNVLKWNWGRIETRENDEETTARSVHVAHEVLVAYPDQQYCMGTIGYGSFQKSTSNNVYAVSSRTIENDKYAAWSDEYHFVMTGDMKRAVKNAKTHLRPYAPKDFFALSISTARQLAEKPLSEANGMAYRTQNDIPNHLLMNEIYRLHKSGHVFGDSILRNTIASWVDATDVQRAETERKTPACYVHVRSQTASAAPENQLVDFFITPNLRDAGWERSATIEAATPTTVKVSDLHPDFVGKISVLSLLTDNDHVDGVGVRISNNVYWIFMEDEGAQVLAEGVPESHTVCLN